MNVVEPLNYEQAKEHKKWMDSMNEKYDAITRNQTWELIELPKNKVPIGRKWLYKSMFKSDGSIHKYNARLVMKGYSKNRELIMKILFHL